MKVFFFLFAAILFLQSLSYVQASVEEVCNKVKDNRDIDYNFCITSLQADPESQKANIQDLAIIATNLTKVNFTHNLEVVKNLLKDPKSSPDVKEALDACAEVYNDGLNAFDGITEEIRSHKISEAMDGLSMTSIDVVTCMDALNDGGNGDLIGKENQDAFNINTIAASITLLLQ